MRVPAREVGGLACAAFERDELLDGLGGAEAALVSVGEKRRERVAAGAKAEAREPLEEVVGWVTRHRRSSRSWGTTSRSSM